MDKLQKLVSDFLSAKFDEWKSGMNENERVVFALYYFKGYSIIKISQEVNYSERQVKRILKSARKKVYKLIP